MRKNSFTFRHFSVKQEYNAMKVGMDGVLLGAWVKAPCEVCDILDVGTGTGLIALCLTQRYAGAHITAVEIDRSAAEEAAENVALSPFKDRIHVVCADFLELPASFRKFDLIVSNPPYFSCGISAPERNRAIARHDESMPLGLFLKQSRKLLKLHGRINLILPADRLEEMRQYAVLNGLGFEKVCWVYTSASDIPKRMICVLAPLVELPPIQVEETLFLTDETGRRTKEYHDLVKELYIK